jgi:hypothetical protein
MSLVKTSKPFQPLVEDLLVRINPSGAVSYANDGLEVTMQVDKTIISIGEAVDITMTLRNIGNDTLSLFFGSSQTFDVFLLGMNVTARWSDGYAFLLIVREPQLQPNQTLGEILQWNFFLYNRSIESFIPPPPGVYTIFGICVGSFESLSGVARVIKGMSESGLRIELVPPSINHDRRVDIIDVAIVARAFGSKLGDSWWNADADIQEDGTINIVDISIVAKSFGKTF